MPPETPAPMTTGRGTLRISLRKKMRQRRRSQPAVPARGLGVGTYPASRPPGRPAAPPESLPFGPPGLDLR
jgi:hypothetical protein